MTGAGVAGVTTRDKQILYICLRELLKEDKSTTTVSAFIELTAMRRVNKIRDKIVGFERQK
jgi:hypothetical protein